jgi:AcrR family transcriptional regulator
MSSLLTPWGDALNLGERALKPGPGTPPEEIARNRRERLYAATVAASAEHGYEGTTVAHLCSLARVSRTAFYGQFNSKHDCFLATIDEIARIGRSVADDSYVGDRTWDEQIEAALEGVVGLVATFPDTARLCYVDAYTAGPDAVERVDDLFASFEEMTIAAIGGSPERADLPPDVVRAVLGGVHVVIEEHLRERREQELPGKAADLWRWALIYQAPAEPLVRPRRRSRPPGVARRIDVDADERILRATAETVSEQGYTATTVADVASAASVSLTTFYDHFDGKEDAFLAALDQCRAQVFAAVLPAYRRGADWREGVWLGLRALLSFFAVETALAGLAAEVRSAGPRAAEHAQETMRMFGELLASGEELADEPPGVSRMAIGGAIYTLAIGEVRAGRAARLPELLPVVTFVALAPYLGVDEAGAVASSS